MKETLVHLERAISLLPKTGVIFSQEGSSIEIRVVRGYKDKGEKSLTGVYDFIERKDGQETTYILTQDSLPSAIIRGVVIKDGFITQTVGFERFGGKIRKENIKDLFDGFNSCEEHRVIDKNTQTGVHHA